MSPILWGLAALLLALFIYGAWIEPAMRLRVVRYDLPLEGWVDEPLTLVLVADLHAGAPQVPLSRVRRIVARANSLGADVAILLGDYAAAHKFTLGKMDVHDIICALKGLDAPLGTYAVLGNHDWWQDPRAAAEGGVCETSRALLAHGIPELDNDAVKLPSGAWLVGLADQRAQSPDPRVDGFDDLDAAMEEVTDDAPAILIAHEPDIFPRVPDQVRLTVSGHTHGGQVRFLGRSPVIRMVWCEVFSYGHYVSDDQHLIVSGGIGCSEYPVRVGMPPELTLVTVHRA
ncbi:MAG: metallophosphoesterase [Pseudomonadota bacterium]